MTKFEKITLCLSILIFIVGCAVSSFADSIVFGVYTILISALGLGLVLISGGYRSQSNIFDNRTNINITINSKDKEDKN